MKKRFSMLSMFTLMLFASALTCLVLALTVGRTYGVVGARSDTVRNFVTMLEMIEELYIGQYEEEDITAAAMRAAVYALDDYWSYYMTPDEYAEFLNSSNNRFAGIGVNVVSDEETGGMSVTYVYRGSGAEAAGVSVGDVIVGVDGSEIYGISAYGLRELLERPVGEPVSLTILRPDTTSVTLPVIFDYIFRDPVSFEMLDGKIGYIQLRNFDAGAANSFISAINKLRDMDARAIIFDVRGNRGGRVSEMTRMHDFLLPEGEIFIAVDRSGTETITYSDPEYNDIPAVVLVDRNSFSAAEYFAAMLSEYGRAEVIGEQTTGKSRMQTSLALPAGGALHISTAQYLTKNRVSLHDIGGFTPEHLIMLSEQESALLRSGELNRNDDPHIAKALLLLQ